MKHKVLKVNPKDNVIVALTNLSKGETISFEGEEFILQDNINAKHKFFTKDFNAGDEIITGPYNAVSKTLKDGNKVKVVPKDKLFEK